jgi:hypothetical protein
MPGAFHWDSEKGSATTGVLQVPAMNDAAQTRRQSLAVTLLLVLLVAAGLRFYRLPGLPLGLHYDEAANGVLAGEIARGIKAPVFIPSYTGKEVLFFYWAALWMKLVGVSPLGLRMGSAMAGVATVAATYWAVRELLHGRRDAGWVSLLTATLLATSFWHVILSRYGFRAVMQPLMQALTVAALWRGMRRGDSLWIILAGLFCGLSAYTYLAVRAFPLPLAAGLLVFLVASRGQRYARLGQIAIFCISAGLALAPLAYYWMTHPGSFLTRTDQVAATSWTEVRRGVRACLAMFFIRGDPYIRFNIPLRPVFDPVTAFFFVVGTAILLLNPKSPISSLRSDEANGSMGLASRAFLLAYLPIMLLPSALATGDITPSNLRAVGLLPFVYLFPALGLSALARLASRFLPWKSLSFDISHLTCVVLILVALSAWTSMSYFTDWAVSPALYYEADGDMAAVADYLNQADLASTTVYVGSRHYRHPTMAFMARDYADVRWLTDGATVVIPGEGDGLLVYARSASQHLGWVESLLPANGLVASPPGPDGEPAFYGFRASEGAGVAPACPLVANLGYAVQVEGYDVVGEPQASETVDIAVWWRVLNPPPEGDYGVVARLVDPWGFVWAEASPFHYPSEQWTAGERVIDLVSIPVGPEAPPGEYIVRFSLYSPGVDGVLPVLDDAGRYAGTYVELPVRLERASVPADAGELAMDVRLDADVGGLTLLGADPETRVVRPGEPIFLTLYWRADDSSPSDRDVSLVLDDLVLYAGPPVNGSYPFSNWTAGEVIADRYGPRLPRTAAAGEYSLQVQVDGLAFELGRVTVEATERTFEVPPISHAVNATLGQQVALLGYGLEEETSKPGDTVVLTLYWQALTEMDESYTVFTHLVAPDGSMTGQRDNLPVGGTYPTNTWLSGEIVADRYEIEVSTEASVGEHILEVGMYIAETGARLPVAGTAADAVALQTITIKE